MNDPKRPILAVTMGDAAGVGPELCLRLLQEAGQGKTDFTPVIIGSAGILRRVSDRTGIPFNAPILSKIEDLARDSVRTAVILDLGLIESPEDVQPGRV